ncbi:MAG: hypothetical protein JO219_09045 [Candidatus Eremiobacteraeota bacterium]|nr:hypothetical protein [Candidatus Eremiobacteraeota bacterium]MBV8366996.1 hypothetical protein [Candidatus Eremiobacteraeota bacterium]
MASDVPAIPNDEGPGTQLAQWVAHFRDRVNLSVLDAQAARPVRLLLAGQGAEELADVIDPDRTARGTILQMLDQAPGWMVADSASRAILFCDAAGTVPHAALAHFESSSLPVFVIDRPPLGETPEESRPTSPHSHRPGPGTPAHYHVSALNAAELGKYLLPDIVAACRDVEISLASSLPIFRPSVAAKITVDCALNCLKVAGASALVDHVPVLGLVLGSIASAGDTIVITGMQVNMLLRIAAAYGKKAEFARIAELLPVIGGGYGWRALAREASGFIPFAGPVIKAGIAYAGTLVLGQAASFYYETGNKMAPEKIGALYREAVERARNVAIDFIERMRKKDS